MEYLIVYYVFINPQKNWKQIVSGQIGDLKQAGIYVGNNVHCVVCTPNGNLFQECKRLINNQNINYTHVLENNFEYPGIKKLHELGTLYPHKILFYMHTKGMVYHQCHGRLPHEMNLLRSTIKNWKYTLNIFKEYQNVQKVGLFPAYNGTVWFNFFWIRGSYLKSLSPPVLSKNRYYYEHLYINSNSSVDCFSLMTYDYSRFDSKNAYLISTNKYRCKFDSVKYINKYPDLKDARVNGYIHFINHGINENRNLI